jgi:NADPH:quinone reductase
MSESMKFVAHGAGGAPHVLHLSETAVPNPAAGELLIKVAYAGVNRPDCLQRSGRYPPPPGASPILGLEASGHVVALGEGVTYWKLGDAVCGLANGGGYAEYVCIPQGQVLPVPSGLTLLQAAALPENYFTVWTNVFERGKLQAGEVFLVHGGSSGIGAHVMCTVGNEEKMRACEAAGADLAINYRTQDFAKEVMDATDQKGVNIILDMVGGDYMQRNINCLSVDGRLVQIAFLQPSKTEVDWIGLMVKRLTFTGSTLRPRTAADKAQIANELHQKVWPMLQQGKCLPVVHQVFDLREATQAHELMESSTHIGKIMIKVAGG